MNGKCPLKIEIPINCWFLWLKSGALVPWHRVRHQLPDLFLSELSGLLFWPETWWISVKKMGVDRDLIGKNGDRTHRKWDLHE